MTLTRDLRRLERPNDDVIRRVLFAVELVDPVTLERRHQDLTVLAKGLTQAPYVNRSGRFVWLREGDAWPGAITVKPDGLPFAPQVAPAPPRPLDLDALAPAQRLVRITLRPTAAYAFEAGLTAVRGRLCEDASPSSPPVAGALVQLAWQDADTGVWFPPLPSPPPTADPDGVTPNEPETDERGQFAVFVRLPRGGLAEPDVSNGLLKVRLQFTRGVFLRVTRVTPPQFEFLPGTSTNPAARGRVRDGQLLARDLKVGWSDLSPI
jgi:hypothetical protein